MPVTGKKVTKLSDDIRLAFTNAFGEDEEMIRICRDHGNPLLFQDKKPVLDITKDEFVGVFNTNANHFFLSPIHVFRLGIYCRLAFPSLIALILKAQWESFIAYNSLVPSNSRASFGSLLSDDNLIENYIKEFKPDS